MPVSQRPCLYRHFADDGTLLYVGISANYAMRLAQHRSASRWFDRIAMVTIEHFETAEAALEAEQTAILAEQPIFNRTLRGLVRRSVTLTEAQWRDLKEVADGGAISLDEALRRSLNAARDIRAQLSGNAPPA